MYGGPRSGQPLVRPVLLCEYVIFGKKIMLQYKRNFFMFIDLFTFLSSIRGFPDASERWKIKLTRT